MIPEYLLWKLCGVKAREYTNATSTGLVNAQTKEYDPEILKALGLPEAMFPKLTVPGTVLGPLKADIAAEVGGQTNVVLCATHDTASAVEGIPMEQGDAPFLSSGTWSLLGVKLASSVTTPESCKANFTNEGGVGYIRYLKNIMGLWIIQCVQKQLGISFAEMVELAKTSTYTRIFDVNEARFSAPQDMSAEIRSALAEPVMHLPPMQTSSTASIIRWPIVTVKPIGKWRKSPANTGISCTSQAAAQRTPP